MVVEKIESYLDADEAGQLRECLEFFKVKLAKTEERVAKTLKKSTAAFIEYYFMHLLDRPGDLYASFLALQGRHELVGKFEFLRWGRSQQYWESFYSLENFNKFKEHDLFEHNKKKDEYMSEGSYLYIYDIYSIYHELDIVRSEGVQILFDNPKTQAHELRFDPETFDDPLPVFRNAHFLMNIGLYDRARHYVEILRKVKETLEKRGKYGTMTAQLFEPMLSFEENILSALTASDPEVARRYAARAILAQMRGIIKLIKDACLSHYWLCYDLSLSLCVAIAFDFDPDWARECCRAMSISLNTHNFHPAFFKEVELEGWLHTPEELGMPDHQQMRELRDKYHHKLREKMYGKQAAPENG